MTNWITQAREAHQGGGKPTEADSMNRLRVQAERKAALYRRALVLACNGDEDQVAYFVSEADAEEDRPNDPHDDLTPGADSTDRAGAPVPPGECSAPECDCDPGLCIQRTPATFHRNPAVPEVGINGLTEAETSATASVMGIVDKITIRYERVGRCFWHIGCKAQRHSPPMAIGDDDSEKRRTVVRCTACGESGYYPFGSVGDVCCERVPLGVSPHGGSNA